MRKKGKFQKGQPAWNKGMKGLHHSPKTEFKKGEFVGENHPSWKGGIQKPKKDCVILWKGKNKRVRRPREIYKKHYGKIPKGFVIYHIDGKSHNDEPTNLKAISRADLVKLNKESHRSLDFI